MEMRSRMEVKSGIAVRWKGWGGIDSEGKYI